ncbi:hypothetical protein JK628_23160 (plasmid) [Shewanella sp. KX20019]|uniref:hypothetical protein n=1 Tax=Shewanella sp. KX20019 TaxID=2803864 RepID=UPI0019254633|nr:hypothetical protein [Shewanella sp. KX20019]QQX82683.1 hypothetical protein JK628_23160 [Shewanella sp. KX20019]
MLSKYCAIETNFENADFWLVRKGSISTVARPTLKFSPEHIGIKFRDEKKFNGKFLFYMFLASWKKGEFQKLAKGTLNLKHITIADIKKLNINFT